MIDWSVDVIASPTFIRHNLLIIRVFVDCRGILFCICWIYLFIYGIFDDILSGSRVAASNYGTINNDYWRTKKDPSYPSWKYCSGFFLQGLRINHENPAVFE